MKINIYKPLGIDGYELCHPVRDDDFETFNRLINGALSAEDWMPVRVEIIRSDMGTKLAESDSPWLGSHAMIFRPNVVEVLGTTLKGNGELLPLVCSDAELVVLNPTHVVDALDEEKSSITRFSSGKIMMIQRYVFRADVIAGIDIFKIPNLRVSPTFVSQRFVDQWNTAGLKGLEFHLVWKSL